MNRILCFLVLTTEDTSMWRGQEDITACLSPGRAQESVIKHRTFSRHRVTFVLRAHLSFLPFPCCIIILPLLKPPIVLHSSHSSPWTAGRQELASFFWKPSSSFWAVIPWDRLILWWLCLCCSGNPLTVSTVCLFGLHSFYSFHGVPFKHSAFLILSLSP